MKSITGEWNFGPIINDVLLKVGDQRLIFEDSSGFKEVKQSVDGSFELGYQLIYIEPNERKPPKDPWSFRQTAVHHGYDTVQKRNRILVIHPKPDTAAEVKLETVAASQQGVLAGHPMSVHLLIISSYMVHWPDHNQSLARELEAIRDHLLGNDINECQFDSSELQRLRHLEDKITTRTCPCLQGMKKIVASLIEITRKLPAEEDGSRSKSISIEQQLHVFNDRLDSFLTSAQTLGERVRATLGLQADILEHQNHNNSDKIQKHMLLLTRENVDDNTTVKFITICTMIYLPASFIATVLGMNVFDFKNETKTLQVSPSFWIYIALTLPLTILTVGSYLYFKRRHDKRRREYQTNQVRDV